MGTGKRNALSLLMLTMAVLGTLPGCGGSAVPKMDWQGEGFFSFPWPNDLRRQQDGTLDLAGFPGTGNPLLATVLAKGVPYINGFSTNAGVVFQFNRALDPSVLPPAKATLADDSVMMLVNIDPDHPAYLQRIPVRSNFDPVTTVYQPGHLLTMMPVPGYSLEPDTRYAAIIFKGLRSLTGEPILAAPLLTALAAGSAPEALAGDLWQQLQDQWRLVASYTADHTAWSPDQVAAFTVYSTMDPTRYTYPVARAIARLDDDSIMGSVTIRSAGPMCGYYSYLPMEADVDLPVWQQGVAPYTLAGGMIAVDEQSGLALQQGWESTRMTILIGCSGGDTARIPMIYADGSGASYGSASRFPGFYDGQTFEHVALSVAPHQTGYRAAPILASYREWLKAIGLNVPDIGIEGLTFYNLFNPPANIGNHIQSAADQLYLRRIALLLPEILQRSDLDQQALNFDFSQFSVRDDTAVLGAHSQGASVAPLAMAMDPVFDIGILSAAASHAYFQATHRGSIRELIPVILPGFVQSEVDYFHPLMQVLQTMHDPADSANYVRDMQTKSLLQTAGYQDGCVPREASAALGFGLARAGLIQPVAPLSRQSSFFDTDQILDLTPLSNTGPVQEPNLENAGIGLFLELGTGHNRYPDRYTAREFLQRVTNSEPELPISLPGYDNGGTGCDVRYEQGYNPS